MNRAAYYMSNWDGLLDSVRSTGKPPTMYAADLAIPDGRAARLGRGGSPEAGVLP